MFLALIGLVPGLLSAWNSWQNKKLDTQVEMFKAKTGADTATARDIVVSANVEAQADNERLKVIASNRWMTFLFVFMSLPVGIYLWQTIVIDKIICKWIWGVTCSTDPIGGEISVWVSTIIAGTFGYGAVQGIAKMWFRGRSKSE